MNINQLFEQRSIAEIDQVHKKLQNDIEEKKVAIRTLVGERYRDLLKAADTIGEMKTTAANVIVHVDKITDFCTKIHEQQLLGFKAEVQRKPASVVNSSLHSVAIQIKILTSLPELIWTNLDRENYLVATQLFILSRHISTGLQLDSNHELMKRFPVVRKQWAFILSPFYFTIKNSCVATMEREELTADVAASCLASLMMLENCDVDKLLTMFVQMRCKAFTNILCDENGKYEKVKDKLLASMKVLIQTVELLHAVFIDDEGLGVGRLIELIKKLADPKSKPSISLLENEDPNVLKSLPDIIIKYRPQIKITELKSDTIRTTMASWLKYIENISQHQLASHVQLITSVKVIHGIKKQANALVRANDWTRFCQNLFLPDDLNFYKRFFQHLVNARIKDIIRTSWQRTVTETQHDVLQLLNQRTDTAFNIYRHVWTEEGTDNPKSLQEVMQRSKSASRLLMKCKGHEPAIVELFQRMDGKVETLYGDLSIYLKNDGLYPGQGTSGGDEAAETDGIVTFLKDCSRESISEFITNIKTSNFKPTPENHILLARLLKACTELCPNLKQCLLAHTLKMTWNNGTVEQTQSSEQWQNMCHLLEEESLRFWRLWLDQFIQDWQKACKSELQVNTELQSVLNIFLNWETITIEEKDEHDNSVQSTIRVPSQPSYPMQQCLDRVCSALRDVLPHTLPPSIAKLLVDRITQTFASHYEKLAADEAVRTNQNLALQYFFDLKWITLMLVTRENKATLDQYNTLVSAYKTFIDPFDFDVFYAHLNNNVKKSGQRMQFQIGCIVPSMDQLLGMLGAGQPQAHEKDPNVLPLSSNASTVNWFPLLPLPSQGDISSKQSSTSDLQQLEKNVALQQQNASATTSTPRTKVKGRERAQPKSGAAAFIQDWFK